MLLHVLWWEKVRKNHKKSSLSFKKKMLRVPSTYNLKIKKSFFSKHFAMTSAKLKKSFLINPSHLNENLLVFKAVSSSILITSIVANCSFWTIKNLESRSWKAGKCGRCEDFADFLGAGNCDKNVSHAHWVELRLL